MSHEQESFGNIHIDTTATKQFFTSKEGKEKGSSPIFIGRNESGTPFLLKTVIQFIDPETRVLLNREEAKKVAAEQYNLRHEGFIDELDSAVENLVLGQQFLEIMSIPTPKAKLVNVQGTPFIAMEYLEDAEDRGFGNLINVESNTDISSLGKMALGKLLTGSRGDAGQILEHNNEYFLIEVNLNAVPQVQNAEDVLNILQKYSLIPPSNPVAREAQIQFLKTSPEIDAILLKLEKFLANPKAFANMFQSSMEPDSVKNLYNYLTNVADVITQLRANDLPLQ